MCLLAVLVASGLLEARPAQGQATGSVRGTVVDDGGGAPLAGTVVTLEEIGLSTTTAADGAFVIDGVPAGDYTLTATRQGFAPLTSGVTVIPGRPSPSTCACRPPSSRSRCSSPGLKGSWPWPRRRKPAAVWA